LWWIDPVVVELAQDIFRQLSRNKACLVPLQNRLVPTLLSILQSPPDKVSIHSFVHSYGQLSLIAVYRIKKQFSWFSCSSW